MTATTLAIVSDDMDNQDTNQIIREALTARQASRGRSGMDINERKLMAELVNRSTLKPDKIREFVEHATDGARTLAEQVLVDQLCEERELMEVLGIVHNMPVMTEIANVEVDGELAEKLDGARARTLRAVPIAYNDQQVPIVVVSNPESISVRDDLPRLLGVDAVELRLATYNSVDELIHRVYESKPFELDTEGEDFQPEEEFTRVSAGDDSPAAKVLNALLSEAQRLGASDIHLQPREGSKSVIRLRIDGIVSELRSLPITAHEQIIRRLKYLGGMETYDQTEPQDGRTTYRSPGSAPLDIRIATVPTVHGEKATLRLMDASVSELSLEDLGMTDANLIMVRRGLAYNQGGFLVTGPTGSGKTTTLYAGIREKNTPEVSIITVEDPVEQKIPGVDQVQVHEEQGLTFATLLRSILRNDPDIVMVGELRDQEAASIAMEAANTGHLVLGTLHANNTLLAISRLAELGVDKFRIATQLKVVTAQRLARRLCTCKVKADATDAYLNSMSVPESAVQQLRADEALALYQANPKGCARCQGSGYKGRIGLHEVLPITKQIEKQILKDPEDIEALRDLAVEAGYHTLFEDGLLKAFRGLTSLEELHRAIDED